MNADSTFTQCLFLVLIFSSKVSYSSDWTQTHSAAKAGLESLIFLPLPPECMPLTSWLLNAFLNTAYEPRILGIKAESVCQVRPNLSLPAVSLLPLLLGALPSWVLTWERSSERTEAFLMHTFLMIYFFIMHSVPAPCLLAGQKRAPVLITDGYEPHRAVELLL